MPQPTIKFHNTRTKINYLKGGSANQHNLYFQLVRFLVSILIIYLYIYVSKEELLYIFTYIILYINFLILNNRYNLHVITLQRLFFLFMSFFLLKPIRLCNLVKFIYRLILFIHDFKIILLKNANKIMRWNLFIMKYFLEILYLHHHKYNENFLFVFFNYWTLLLCIY